LNPQHSVWKTATQPFEFRSLVSVISQQLSVIKFRLITDNCWLITVLLCKMKKAEILDRLRAQLCSEQVNKIFFFGTRQSFYRRRKSFQTLCLFSFFVRTILLFAASSLTKKSKFPNFFRLFSCQISVKTKRAATFKFLFSRTFASPLLKQFLSSTTR
jgi:hypothetical protein